MSESNGLLWYDCAECKMCGFVDFRLYYSLLKDFHVLILSMANDTTVLFTIITYEYLPQWPSATTAPNMGNRYAKQLKE